MILFSWTCKFLIVALGLVGIFEFSQEFLWLKVTKIHYQWLTVQKKIFLSVLIPTCDWHICLISLTFQTKDITIYLAEIRDSSSEKIFLKVLIYFSDQSLSAPCVYHWRCLDYHYKCYLFILSYFSKLGDFFTDNIKPAFPTLFKTIGLGIFPTFIQCVVWVMCFNISLEKVLSRWMSCIKVKRLTTILRPHVFCIFLTEYENV